VEITYSAKAQEDIQFWKRSGDLKAMSRISALLDDIEQHPFSGIGKPEALKYKLAGCWSRRITNEHRLVYRVTTEEIEIISMRFHYQ
jgi:toxin YoeB